MKDIPDGADAVEVLERDLEMIGLVGMIDPPREGVKESIRICKNAGIKTVMITGENCKCI